MNKNCTKCGGCFEPSAAQIAKSYWVCKPCRKVQDAENLAKRKADGKQISGTRLPKEYHATYAQAYKARPGVREKKAKQAKIYRNGENRHKHEARWKVARAIKSGSLVRQPCEVCGYPKAEAHHPDYSKPLVVSWLCRTHHVEVHSKARGQV